MKRIFTSYPVNDFYEFKSQLLNFGKRFSNFCFLDSHTYEVDKSFDCIAGCGDAASVETGGKKGLNQLQSFIDEWNDWMFGHLSYDLKNETEGLSSSFSNPVGFDNFYFFVPEVVFVLRPDHVEIGANEKVDTGLIYQAVISKPPFPALPSLVTLKPRLTKEAYLKIVRDLQHHILRGDCYEICFCHEHYDDNARIDPFTVYRQLCTISPTPFSALYKNGEKYLICASPERFLKKEGDRIFSQPVKGTLKRTGIADGLEVEQLGNDAKERAENIMIVDLVRNDLAKICREGSVHVRELMGIYSFPQVHQMISTVQGTLSSGVSFTDILRASFPMGSMTGAPKKRVMELIDTYEKTSRGLFSGCVGYLSPSGNFDLNVVIRSILYNHATHYLSVPVGSAITWQSDPQKEFEECEHKIEGIRKILT